MRRYEQSTQELRDAFDAVCKGRVEAAVQAEREACAKVCESTAWTSSIEEWRDMTKKDAASKSMLACAAAIRARGEYEQVAGPSPRAYPLAQPEQEPVECETCNGRGVLAGYAQDGSFDGEDCPDCTPPPPQRKPLSDEEIEKILVPMMKDGMRVSMRDFARAIEAAHNIKEQS